MGNEQSSPLQQAAAHDDIDKVHALIAQNRIELNGTDKVAFLLCVASIYLKLISLPVHSVGWLDSPAFRVLLGQS